MSRNRLHVALVGAVALGTTMIASAARADDTAPAALNWTGFYIGAYAGYGWATTTATDAGDSQSPPLGWYSLGARFAAHPDGFIGGGQAGYNYQFENVVAGIEADVGYLGVNGSGLYPDGKFFDTFVRTNASYDTTLRGRLGIAAGSSLFYVTGGAILADLRTDVKSFGTFMTNRTGAQWGWTVGGGWEYAISPRWSIKSEYLYYDMGAQDVFLNNPSSNRFSIKNTGHLLRIGVNYRFGKGV